MPYLRQAESRGCFLHPVLDHNSFRAQWYRSLSSLWHQSWPSQQESVEVPGELEAEKGQIECVMLQTEGGTGRTGERHLPVPACTETMGGFSGKGLSYIRVRSWVSSSK